MYRPYQNGGARIRIGGPLTPAIKVLLIANVVVFAFFLIPQMFSIEGNGRIVTTLYLYLGMTPELFWQHLTLWMPFTYMFLHGGFYHILFNMFALWMFGGDVENVFGTRQFVVFYFFCGVGAGLSVAVIQPLLSPEMGMVPTVGASGAIYGVILAFGLFFPERVIYLNFLIPIKAKWFVLIVGGMVFLSSLADSGGGISHLAHLGGLVFGFLFIKRRKIWAALRGSGGKRRRPHIRIVGDKESIRRMFEDDDDDYIVH
jgi:membrane associated rhomboid family serine protease